MIYLSGQSGYQLTQPVGLTFHLQKMEKVELREQWIAGEDLGGLAQDKIEAINYIASR